MNYEGKLALKESMFSQKSELGGKIINLGGREKLLWTMRDSQQASSKTVEKNEEPRAEKIELIQALNE